MLTAIGELLPLAVGVAISPLPMIALIVLLMGSRSSVASAGFLLGWMLATASVLAVFAFVSGAGFMKAQGMASIVAVIKMILGAALLVLAIWEWRKRPRHGARATASLAQRGRGDEDFWGNRNGLCDLPGKSQEPRA